MQARFLFWVVDLTKQRGKAIPGSACKTQWEAEQLKAAALSSRQYKGRCLDVYSPKMMYDPTYEADGDTELARELYSIW